MPVTAELGAELEERARSLGAHGDFQAWVGTENYEMRVAPDSSWIDRQILDRLRAAGPDA